MRKVIDKDGLLVVLVGIMMTAVVFLPVVGNNSTNSNIQTIDQPQSDAVLEMYEDNTTTINLNDYLESGWDSIEVNSADEVDYSLSGSELTILPAENWFGNTSLSVTATYYLAGINPPPNQDTLQSVYLDTVNVSLSILPVNDAPRLSDKSTYRLKTTTDSDYSLPEALDLGMIFDDVDSDLSYSWESMNGMASVSIEGSMLRSISTGRSEGDDVITITATDGEYECSTDLLMSLFPKEYIYLQEDTYVEIPLEGIVDPQIEEYILIDPPYISSSLNNMSVECTPDKNWFGVGDMGIFTVPLASGINPPPENSIASAPPGDSINPPEPNVIEFGYYEIGLSVIPVNDRPLTVVDELYLVNMSSDSTYDFGDGYEVDMNDLFDDVDDDLTFSWVSEKGYAYPILLQDKMYAISAYHSDDTVIDRITILASDGEYVAEYDIYVAVQPRRSVSMSEDNEFTLNLDDFVDASKEYFYMAGSNNILSSVQTTFDGNALATLSPAENWYGEDIVRLYTVPREDSLVQENRIFSAPGDSNNPPLDFIEYGFFEFDVTVSSVNDEPVASDIPTITINEDEPLSSALDLDSYFSDIDSTLSYSITGGSNVFASVNENNEVTLTPSDNWFGTDRLIVMANDGDSTVSREFDVVVTPLNDPPSSLGYTEWFELPEDSALDLDISGYFVDVDDTVQYSFISDENISVTLNSTTGLANISPAANWNGQATVTFYASDGEYSASQETEFMVSAVNDAPEICSNITNIDYLEDNSEIIDLGSMFDDIDSNLTYSASMDNTDIRARIAPASDILTLTSSSDWSGRGTLTLTASDGEYAVSKSVEVVVSPVNDAPVMLQAVDELSFSEDATYEIDLDELFYDVDSQLSYSGSSNAYLDITVDTVDNVVDVVPVANWYGVSEISLTATDGEFEVTKTITCLVRPVNDMPVMKKALPQVIVEGDSYILDLNGYFSDVDGDSLTFDIQGSDNIIITPTGTKGIYEISCPDDWTGAETLSVTVSDGTAQYRMPISIASMPATKANTSGTVAGGSNGMLMIALVISAIGMVAITATARTRIRGYRKPEMEGA